MTIESSGGRPGSYNNVRAAPSALRVASYVLIEECVGKRFGSGGFQTYEFSNVIDWSQVEVMMDGGWFRPPPVAATFLTITVTGSNQNFNPGNYDPGVPNRLASAPATEATIKDPNAPDTSTRSHFWLERASRMHSGGSNSWWRYPDNQLSTEMAYECDIGLGNPSVNDCAHIQWDQLGPPSDSVAILPGVVQFFRSSKQRNAFFSLLSLFTLDFLLRLSKS